MRMDFGSTHLFYVAWVSSRVSISPTVSEWPFGILFPSPSWRFTCITCWCKRDTSNDLSASDTLASCFPECFFVGGQVPKSDFGFALMARTGEITSASRRKRLRARQVANDHSSDLRRILGTDLNNFFTAKSNLGLYHEVEGNVESNPKSDITTFSLLAAMRLDQIRQYTDETGKRRPEETELVRRHLTYTGGSRDGPPTMADLVQLVDHWRQTVSGLQLPKTMPPGARAQAMFPELMELEGA